MFKCRILLKGYFSKFPSFSRSNLFYYLFKHIEIKKENKLYLSNIMEILLRNMNIIIEMNLFLENL